MIGRHFNWKLAIVFLLGFGIIAGTVAGLHYFQNSGRYDEYLRQGEESYELGEWEEATISLGKYIASFRKDTDPTLKAKVLHKYAEAQLKIRPSKSGNIQQAVGSFREILRIAPEDRTAATQLIEIYLQRRAIGEATLVAKRFLKEHRDAQVESLLAEALIMQREFSEAYAKLQSVIANEPNQISAYRRLAGITKDRPDDYEVPAAHWLDLAVENNPESPSAYLARARFNLFDQGKTLAERKALAGRDLETALQKTISDPEEHMTIALLCRDLEQEDRMQEQLDAFQKLQPDHLGMWLVRAGMALMSQDNDKEPDKEKMRQVADEGLAKLNENKWGFYAIAAELYARADAFDQANACLKPLNDQGNRPGEVAFLEGLIAFQQKRVQAAVQKWQRALALGYDGASPSIQYYLGVRPMSLKFQLALALEQLGDTLSSRQMLESWASDNTDDLSAQLRLAARMARIGNWTQTKVHTQRVLSADPNTDLYGEAIPLDLEADVMLLVQKSKRTSVDEIQWQAIQHKVEQFEGADGASVFVPLLKCQIALGRHDFKMAEEILDKMMPTEPLDQQKVTLARVNLLYAQKTTNEIIALLKRAVEKHDQSAYLVRLLAYFMLEAGEVDAVEQVLLAAMSRLEKPQDRLKLGYVLSDLRTQWGRQEDSRELLESLDKEYPDTILVQRRLLQNPNVFDEKAQILIDKIRAIEGEEGWQWRYEQARLWSVQDDSEDKRSEAVSLLQQNLRNNGNDQSSRMLLADIQDKAGQSSLALANYRNALDRDPNNLSIIVTTVKALQAADKLDDALDILERAAQRDLKDPSLDGLKVTSYLQQNQVASAATLMKSCLAADPNNVDIALDLATLKVAQEEYDVAKAMIDEIKQNSHDASRTFRLESLEIRMLMQQELLDQALERCDALVATYNDAESLELRFNVKMMLQQFEGAKKDLDDAIAFSQDNAGLLVKKSGLCWLNKQKAEADDNAEEAKRQKHEALNAMDQAISLAPTDSDVVLKAINLFVAANEPDRVATAQAMLQQASQKDPDDYRFKIQKVRFMLMDADAASQMQAEALLEELTIDHSEEAGIWRMLGDLLISRKEYTKALNVAMRGLTELKGNLELLSLKASAEMQMDPELAIMTLQTMLEQSPGHVGVALRLATAHIQAKKTEKAIDVLNAHKAKCTSQAEIKLYDFTMVSALLDVGQQTEAIALLDQLRQTYPDDPLTVIVRIPHWISQKNYKAVGQAVKDWLEVHPEEMGPVQYYAETVLRSLLGEKEALAVSEALLSVAVNKQPESEVFLMLAAQTCHVQGLVDEAAKFYERILEVNGRNVVAMNNLAWIYGQDHGEIEKAMQLAQEGLKLTPQYTDLLDTYGALCYKAKKYDQAIKSFKECLNRPSYKQASSAAATMYMLAQSYLARGDKTNARSMFEQSLDRNVLLERKGIMGLDAEQKRDAEIQRERLRPD